MRPVFSVLSGAGSRARLSILIFHRVLRRPDPLLPGEVDASRFEAICGWLQRWFQVLPLETALEQLQQGQLPPRSLCITFDDGYADNHDVALPILQRHGLKATFFVTAGVVGGGCMWNDAVIESVRQADIDCIDADALGLEGMRQLPLASADHRRQAVELLLPALKHLPDAERSATVERLRSRCGARLPSDLMMNVAQIRALRAAGMGVGGHTMTHPILTRLPDAAAQAEIVEGKRQLEGWLDNEVCLFAYPNGKPGDDFDDRHVRMAREAGFRAALSTRWGVATTSSDRFAIPRFTPWARDRWRFGFQLARNMTMPVAAGA